MTRASSNQQWVMRGMRCRRAVTSDIVKRHSWLAVSRRPISSRILTTTRQATPTRRSHNNLDRDTQTESQTDRQTDRQVLALQYSETDNTASNTAARVRRCIARFPCDNTAFLCYKLQLNVVTTKIGQSCRVSLTTVTTDAFTVG